LHRHRHAFVFDVRRRLKKNASGVLAFYRAAWMKIPAIPKVWLDYLKFVDVDKISMPEHHGAL
jgi:hypothetical protein